MATVPTGDRPGDPRIGPPVRNVQERVPSDPSAAYTLASLLPTYTSPSSELYAGEEVTAPRVVSVHVMSPLDCLMHTSEPVAVPTNRLVSDRMGLDANAPVPSDFRHSREPLELCNAYTASSIDGMNTAPVAKFTAGEESTESEVTAFHTAAPVSAFTPYTL